MTKKEYIEFTNLQEHYEWLHAAEDRAKTKLKTFTTDDSEFDELVREAVKVYFETEIAEAWKKIEEFKTAPTFVNNRADAIRYCSEKNEPEYVEILDTFDQEYRKFKVTELKEAQKVCTSGPCGHTACPLAGRDDCVHIWEAYNKGKYKEV